MKAPRPTLVLAAWAPETAPIRKRLAFFRRKASAPPPPVAIATVGVGLVAAAVGTIRAIDRHRPKAIVLIGTAGTYQKGFTALAIGSVAVARIIRLCSGELESDHAYLPAPMANEVTANNAQTKKLAKLGDCPAVDVACTMGITKSPQLAKRLASCGDVENLEAFAIATAARQSRVPFSAVFGITNRVGPKAHAQWKQNAASAVQSANDLVARWLFMGPIRP